MMMGLEQREIPLQEIKFADTKADDAPAGVFSGYGAYFGNIDSYGDVIKQGAFERDLGEWASRGKWPPMLLQHGGGMFGGGADDMTPIGQWTSMEENARGLKVEGRLFALDTDRAKYIVDGLKTGVLDGLSIGFQTKQSIPGSKPSDPERTITDIDLFEVSIVTFPANPKARITAVKSLTAEQSRDVEAILRDEGLSHGQAVTALAGFKRWLRRDGGGPGRNTPRDVVVPEDEREAAELLAAIQVHTADIWAKVFNP